MKFLSATTLLAIVLVCGADRFSDAETTSRDKLKLNSADDVVVETLIRTLKATETHRKDRQFKIEILNGKNGWMVNYVFLPIGIGDELMCRVQDDGTVRIIGAF